MVIKVPVDTRKIENKEAGRSCSNSFGCLPLYKIARLLHWLLSFSNTKKFKRYGLRSVALRVPQLKTAPEGLFH